MSYKIVWESESRIWCRFSGPLHFADVNAATDEFYHDPRSDRVRAALWDFTETTQVAVGEEEASEIAATDAAASRYMKPLKAAFITGDSELATLAEHYIREMEQFGSPWTNRLFATIDEARSWVASDS